MAAVAVWVVQYSKAAVSGDLVDDGLAILERLHMAVGSNVEDVAPILGHLVPGQQHHPAAVPIGDLSAGPGAVMLGQGEEAIPELSIASTKRRGIIDWSRVVVEIPSQPATAAEVFVGILPFVVHLVLLSFVESQSKAFACAARVPATALLTPTLSQSDAVRTRKVIF
jgi:hypothetical protein